MVTTRSQKMGRREMKDVEEGIREITKHELSKRVSCVDKFKKKSKKIKDVDNKSLKRKRNNVDEEGKSAKETIIRIGDTVNLSDLLFTKNRNYLIPCNHQNTNKQVKAKDLAYGKEIAVKSLKLNSGQGEREFQAEVDIISCVHHRHLVSLVGYCIAGSQRLLSSALWKIFKTNFRISYYLLHESGPIALYPSTAVVLQAPAAPLPSHTLPESCPDLGKISED
ncbi:hypothetical protein POM88_043157 [Heracleum sosnowskyi]|uniref:non-specific serine/threonine protein kinase n=1 Tax=Heracleum sosnowskyi TaxID=360622 RepID=A0AAD8M467_9APIA|nr:hypothetical protein POM88_043157 [Heracleum sosnowskyi]